MPSIGGPAGVRSRQDYAERLSRQEAAGSCKSGKRRPITEGDVTKSLESPPTQSTAVAWKAFRPLHNFPNDSEPEMSTITRAKTAVAAVARIYAKAIVDLFAFVLGILPLRAIVAAFDRIGYDSVASVEIFRPQYWEMDPVELAKQAYTATTEVLSTARQNLAAQN